MIQVSGQHVDGVTVVAPDPLGRVGDAQMQGAGPPPQDASVRHFLHEGVAEGEEITAVADPFEEVGLEELLHRGPELGKLGGGVEQVEGDLGADGGGDFERVGGPALEPIEPSCQRALDRRGQRQSVEPAIGFADRAHQLGGEERVATRAPAHGLDELGRRVDVQRFDERGGVVVTRGARARGRARRWPRGGRGRSRWRRGATWRGAGAGDRRPRRR